MLGEAQALAVLAVCRCLRSLQWRIAGSHCSVLTVAVSLQGSQRGCRLESCPVPGAAHPSALSALPGHSANAPLSQKLLLHADGE